MRKFHTTRHALILTIGSQIHFVTSRFAKLNFTSLSRSFQFKVLEVHVSQLICIQSNVSGSRVVLTTQQILVLSALISSLHRHHY